MISIARARGLVRRARRQPRGMRLAFLLRSLHRRAPRFVLNRKLGRLLRTEISPYLVEFAQTGIVEHTMEADAEYRKLEPGWASGTITPTEGSLLYAAVRATRPGRVVETGTANGSSTAYILAALARNEAGSLVSIDLPFVAEERELRPLVGEKAVASWATSPVPGGREPGWMVPDELRGRWELRLGDARDLLPKTLDELGEIDMFFHDSLHSREHMLFEFEAVWPHLAPCGLLVSDDVFTEHHDAVPAFANAKGAKAFTFMNLAVIQKPRA